MFCECNASNSLWTYNVKVERLETDCVMFRFIKYHTLGILMNHLCPAAHLLQGCGRWGCGRVHCKNRLKMKARVSQFDKGERKLTTQHISQDRKFGRLRTTESFIGDHLSTGPWAARPAFPARIWFNNDILMECPEFRVYLQISEQRLYVGHCQEKGR